MYPLNIQAVYLKNSNLPGRVHHWTAMRGCVECVREYNHRGSIRLTISELTAIRNCHGVWGKLLSDAIDQQCELIASGGPTINRKKPSRKVSRARRPQDVGQVRITT